MASLPSNGEGVMRSEAAAVFPGNIGACHPADQEI